MKNIRTHKGFTLIELLIVITIIGILAVAIAPTVLGTPARARDTARKADVNNIILALESYNSDHGSYPDGNGCIETVGDGSNTNVLTSYFRGGNVPKDPNGNKDGVLNCAAGANSGYVYCPIEGDTTTGASYIVVSKLEVEGTGNATQANIDAFQCDALTLAPALAGSGGNYWVQIR